MQLNEHIIILVSPGAVTEQENCCVGYLVKNGKLVHEGRGSFIGKEEFSLSSLYGPRVTLCFSSQASSLVKKKNAKREFTITKSI